MSAGAQSGRDYSAMARVGGLTRVSRLTPEEISAEMSERANARWAKERARRAAEGLPPLSPQPRRNGPPREVLEPFLEPVMKAHPEWNYSEQHRQAVSDYRLYLARIELGGKS